MSLNDMHESESARVRIFTTYAEGLYGGLDNPNVREVLGDELHAQHLKILSRLTLATIERNRVSLPKADLKAGRVAVAVLSPGEMQTHTISDELAGTLLPEQEKTATEILGYPLMKVLKYTMHAQKLRRKLIGSSGSTILPDAAIPNGSVIGLPVTMSQANGAKRYMTARPTMILNSVDTPALSKVRGAVLFHENQHIIQALTGVCELAKGLDEDQMWLIVKLIRENEAHSLTARYLEALGVPLGDPEYYGLTLFEQTRRMLRPGESFLGSDLYLDVHSELLRHTETRQMNI